MSVRSQGDRQHEKNFRGSRGRTRLPKPLGCPFSFFLSLGCRKAKEAARTRDRQAAAASQNEAEVLETNRRTAPPGNEKNLKRVRQERISQMNFCVQEVRGLSLGKLLHTHKVVAGTRAFPAQTSDTAPRRTRLDLLRQQLVRQVLSVA